MAITSLLDRWPLISCVFIVLFFVVAGFIVLFKCEGQARDNPQSGEKEDARTARSVVSADGNIYSDELWTAMAGSIHPGWLLGFRVLAFLYLLPIQLYNIFQLGGVLTYYYYTQWTFTLLIAYFGLAACISATNILPRIPKRFVAPQSDSDPTHNLAEDDSLLPGKSAKGTASLTNASEGYTERPRYGLFAEGNRSKAGVWGYVMQIGFQVAAPAVLLTDGVYWFVLIPFLLPPITHDFVDINQHGVNALFFVIELFLNDLRFPWFRGGYLVMWSAAYVFFQWFLHLVGFTVWPYPFLNLSTPYAPAWYMGLSLFHLVCFCICLLLAQAKQSLRGTLLR